MNDVVPPELDELLAPLELEVLELAPELLELLEVLEPATPLELEVLELAPELLEELELEPATPLELEVELAPELLELLEVLELLAPLELEELELVELVELLGVVWLELSEPPPHAASNALLTRASPTIDAFFTGLPEVSCHDIIERFPAVFGVGALGSSNVCGGVLTSNT